VAIIAVGAWAYRPVGYLYAQDERIKDDSNHYVRRKAESIMTHL